MWQAALTLGGVVLGAAIAGGVSLWQVQLVTAREREARRTDREQVRSDVRDAFQREAILSLQEAVADFLRMAVAVHSESVEEEDRTGQWRKRRHSVDFPAGFDEHFARIQGFRARVFDDELRWLALEVLRPAVAALEAEDGGTAVSRLADVAEKHKQLQERINVLLKELF
jgi:hypothetical protein